MKKITVLFLLISLALTSFWFRGASTMGGGEIGNPFYNMNRMEAMSGMAWADPIVGQGVGLAIGAAPYYKVLSILQNMGVPGFVLQAGFFFICLFLAFEFSFLLAREIFPNLSFVGALASALFYVVNPYALVNIWNRFLVNPILFYSFLPLGLWLYITGLKKKRYVYALVDMLLTGVFATGFVGPSQTLSFWVLLLLISIFYYFFIEKKRFVIYYFLISVFLWIFFNFYWISQEIYFRFSSSFEATSSQFFTAGGNIQTFNAQSKVLGQISNLFIFQHAPFFNENVDYPYKWPLFYVNPLAKVIEWLIILAVLSFATIKRKSKWVVFLFSIFFIGIIASKGNSAPFGEILDFMFRKFSFLEFFRNPFEKLGFLLPLAFAPLFGLTFEEVRKKIKAKWLINLGVFFYLVVFLGFPFWTGLVFTSNNPPANDPKVGYQVDPPSYYKEADKYLSSQPGIFRFITFPLGGEGIFNNWPKGYAGVEQSNLLFSTPSISFNTGVPFLHEIASNLEQLFLKNNDFYKIARLFSARFLIFRPDFDFKLSGMRDPAAILKRFDELIKEPVSKLSLTKNFSVLGLYEFSKETILPKFYAANELIVNNSASDIEDALLAEESANPAILTVPPARPELENKASETVVHSTEQFQIPSGGFPSYSEDPYIFPHIAWLPNSKFYSLVLIKEQMQRLAKVRAEDRANWDLSILGKRLMEAKKSLDVGDTASAEKAISLYKKSFPRFLGEINTLNSFDKLPGERVWHEGELFSAFSAHAYILNQLEKSSLNKDASITALNRNLQEVLIRAKIIPFFGTLSTEKFPLDRRVVYQLTVNSPGDYEILFPKTKFFPTKFSWGDSINVQVDDKTEQRKVTVEDKFVSLGRAYFDRGIHEIAVNQNSNTNLVGEPRAFDFETADYTKEVDVPISELDPFSQYDVSFDYWTEKGDGVQVIVRQNTDPLPTLRRPDFTYFQSKTFIPDYYYDYQHYSTSFAPQLFTDSAKLAFLIKPWSNCRLVNYKHPDKCKKYDFNFQYYRKTKVYIKNIVVNPLLPEQIELVKRDSGILQPPTSVNFSRINPTLYDVEIKGAQKPFLLVFSELFDTGWKAYLIDNAKDITQRPFGEPWRINQISDSNHFLINGYANAWWVDRTGNFHLVLEFGPQRFLYIGYAVSGAAVLIAVLFLLFKLIKLKVVNE